MKISIIAAVAENNVIGNNNELIWHLPADLRFFKQTTKGHYIIMGRKTFESFKKPLPDRTHVVVTRNTNYTYEGVYVAHDIDQALGIARKGGEQEVFVLGGGEIYKAAMDKATVLYITEVKGSFEGDTSFPQIDLAVWKEVRREGHGPDEKNPYGYSFVKYERTSMH